MSSMGAFGSGGGSNASSSASPSLPQHQQQTQQPQQQQQQQQPYIGQEDFDMLLHSNVLDTLADFDFGYADLGGGEATVSPPIASTKHGSSTRTTGRKRSFSQTAGSWDNMSPKALSELSAGLFAGAWESGAAATAATAAAAAVTSPSTLTPASSPNPSTEQHDTGVSSNIGNLSTTNSSRRAAATTAVDAATKCPSFVTLNVKAAPRCAGNWSAPVSPPPMAYDSADSAANNCHEGTIRDAPATAVRGKIGVCKKRKNAAGAGASGGKRPLNPDRMERKASREKRRREEVNEKFEQLLKVLEDAETTSGLEPPTSADGNASTNACINGRRVEVLSRTINVLKKLLRERLNPHPASTSAPCSPEEGPTERRNPEEEMHLALSTTGIPTTSVSDSAAGAKSSMGAVDLESAAAVQNAQPAVSATVGAPASTAAAASAPAVPALNRAAVHHMAMPMSAHHPSMTVPPGFAASIPPGMSGQPIFIAVPMYMPPGQGMPPAESGAPLQQVQMRGIAAPAATDDGVDSCDGGDKVEGSCEPLPAPALAVAKVPSALAGAKDAWTMSPGVNFQSMMALQMPQFVTQALSTDDDDEKPTHAVCA